MGYLPGAALWAADRVALLCAHLAAGPFACFSKSLQTSWPKNSVSLGGSVFSEWKSRRACCVMRCETSGPWPRCQGAWGRAFPQSSSRPHLHGYSALFRCSLSLCIHQTYSSSMLSTVLAQECKGIGHPPACPKSTEGERSVKDYSVAVDSTTRERAKHCRG